MSNNSERNAKIKIAELTDIERDDRKRRVSDAFFNIFNYTLFIIFALLCIFPFYYIFINTVSDNELVRTGQITFLPEGVHLENYLALANVNGLWQSLWVSVARTVLGTGLMVFASAMVGYLVTKKEMFGRKIVYRFIVATMYFNAGIIPGYMNMEMLGLTNSFMVYVIPGIIAAYNIVLVKTYIESIPASLEESAQIDGAGYFTRFFRIILPLTKPILATVAIFGAVGHWNSFIDSMLYMSGRPELYTLQYRLYIYMNSTSNLGALMSSGGAIAETVLSQTLNMRSIQLTVAMFTIIPILVVYPFMQRYFQKGIMIGSVKG